MTESYPMKYVIVNVFQVETAAELPQPSATGGSGLSQEVPNTSKFVVMFILPPTSFTPFKLETPLKVHLIQSELIQCAITFLRF